MMATDHRRRSRRPRTRRFEPVEALETRELLSTFTVSSPGASGPGTLRQAILSANANPGPDTIDFSVDGTIQVGRRALPAITGAVTIDGTSAPHFAGTPAVTVNFRGTQGLRFAPGSDGSSLLALALVRSGGAGVTIAASNVTVQGNDIGVLANGATRAGNRGDGIRILASSHGDLIGQLDPVTGVSYYNSDSVGLQPVSGWQGIRDSGTPGQYLITGTSGTNGLLYAGPISGAGGTSYAVDYPGATSTSLYGPDVVAGNILRLVGSYKTGNGQIQGFSFQGTTADLSNPADYQTIDYPGVSVTYVHSTAGGLAVGNGGDVAASTDHAFLFNYANGQFTDIVYPGATTTSAYGIWFNGGTSYTIAGGYNTLLQGSGLPTAAGYLVDYDASTGQFSHWTSISGPGASPTGSAIGTHFEGISGPQQGVYTLAAGTTDLASGVPLGAYLATVSRNPDGTFGPASWVPLHYPGATGSQFSNSVADNQIVGIVTVGTGIISYQATVNTGFRLSNVISGNGGNGIGIYGASGNQVAMNNIGTDASGTIAVGNRKDGILITRGASHNLIGGTTSGGNDPTAGVIARPTQGNLISGNRGDGVLITGGATANTLSGNFVGTTASGDSALGNRGDGVAIVRANGNSLIGCQVQDHPFIYYNVVSGNGGNGLRITNSNDTTVQANFLGAGANNASVVANRRDGLLVSGSSANTQVGGVIPLGNVISGNNQNGIEVTGRASGFTSFNTFGGVFAFAGAAPNRRDGILITSSGGDNQVRTCIISGNLGNGIEIGGHATGVQVTQTATGTNTAINAPIPNGGDGIKVDGQAHGIAIGGFQPSVEPATTASSNARYGIEVAGHARDVAIFHANIGTSALGTQPLGNALGGVAIGPGTSSVTVGGAALPFQDTIRFNDGAGVIVRSSRGDRVFGSTIGNNTGDGLTLLKARQATIGGPLASGLGNRIISNGGYGLTAAGASNGSVVQGNAIAGNTLGTVNIGRARGLTYIP